MDTRCRLAGLIAAAVAALALPAPAHATDTAIFAHELAGEPWAVTTAYTAQTSSLALEDASNSVVASCTGGTLSGGTLAPIATGATDDAALAVASASFSGCTAILFGAITVTATTSSPWSGHVSGDTSPFPSQLTGVTVTAHGCNYTGNLTTGATVTNSVSGSSVSLSHAGTLTRTTGGGVCVFFPATAKVSGTFTLTTVDGAAVSGENNLFVKQNEKKFKICRDDPCATPFQGALTYSVHDTGGSGEMWLKFSGTEWARCDTFSGTGSTTSKVGSAPWNMAVLQTLIARTGGTGGGPCTLTGWAGLTTLAINDTGPWNLEVRTATELRVSTFQLGIDDPVADDFTCRYAAAYITGQWSNASVLILVGTANLAEEKGKVPCPKSVDMNGVLWVKSDQGATLYLLAAS